MRVLWVASLCLGLILTFACGGSGGPDLDAKVVTEGVYSNEFFGVKVPIPDGWHVASKDTEDFMREAGLEAVAGDDAALKSVIEAARKTTFQLLTLSKHEMGAPVDFNPNLIVLAEKVSHVPGIKTGKDYLYHSSKLLLQTALPYEVVRETYPAKLGNRKWYRGDFLLNQPTMPIKQAYYASKEGDYVFLVILSGVSDEQIEELEEIAQKVEL